VRGADITFVILTRNEAANIASCLRSIPPESRVLVYDARSQDETVDLARSMGAEVSVAPWEGYVLAREAAARLARTPWTFMLDADERVTPDLLAELAQLAPPAEVEAYSVPRRNWFCGRWLRCAGWWPDRLVRLFRTGAARIRSRGSDRRAGVHETWTVDARCEPLQAPLDHYSYPSLAEYRRKFALYTSLESQSGNAGMSAVIVAWIAAPLRAGWLMLRRGGILQGWRGWYVCVASAVYPAVVATKSWRRSRLPS
jgi:glycosyltransferase involved in cell wall biosynthesis